MWPHDRPREEDGRLLVYCVKLSAFYDSRTCEFPNCGCERKLMSDMPLHAAHDGEKK